MKSGFHTNIPLTNMSIAFSNRGLYIVDKVFPVTKVKQDSNKYLIYDSDFRVADDKKADGARSRRITYDATSATYFCDDYGLEDVITERQKRNTDAPMNLEKDTTENLTDKLYDAKEVRAAELAFTKTSWTNNTTLTAGWNDYTADVADPLSAIDTGVLTIQKAVAKVPNKAVIGRDVVTHLKNNYRVLDRIKYTQRGVVTAELIAAMCELDEIIVGNHVTDSTNEATTASGGFTWGDDMLIAYINPSPGMKQVTATKQFTTTGRRVRKWMDEEGPSEVIEVTDNYDFAQPATGAGYLIKDTDASG